MSETLSFLRQLYTFFDEPQKFKLEQNRTKMKQEKYFKIHNKISFNKIFQTNLLLFF